MKLSWTRGVALVIGGILLGGVLSAAAQDDGSSGANKPMHFRAGRGPGGPGGWGKGIVRSESVREGDGDGQFVTMRSDHGVLEAITGNTLTIKEADGTIVHVGLNDHTTIRRDGEEAKIGDLKVGDHAATFREKEGATGYVTKHVMAISPERWAEMEKRREECENDAEMCRAHHPARGPGRRGHVEPAPEPADDGRDEAAA